MYTEIHLYFLDLQQFLYKTTWCDDLHVISNAWFIQNEKKRRKRQN